MRKVHISCSSKKIAERIAPWAYKIIKVHGGYIAFESVYDFKIWNNQK